MKFLWEIFTEIFSGDGAVHPIHGDPRMDRWIREYEYNQRWGDPTGRSK